VGYKEIKNLIHHIGNLTYFDPKNKKSSDALSRQPLTKVLLKPHQ